MAELIAALSHLPAEMRPEVDQIVTEAATLAKGDVEAVYQKHKHTGNLAGGLRLKRNGSGSVTLASTAPHSHLFEFGTQIRRTRTGANRGLGPPHPTIVPAAQRRRKQMYEKLEILLQKKGFVTSGNPD